MKKITFLATLMALSISSAMAADGLNFGRIDYSFRDYDGSKHNQNGINLAVGREIQPGFVVDGRSEFQVQNGTQNTTTRLEGGASVVVPLYSDFTGYVRGAVGERFTSGNSYSYYSIEPGILVALDKNWGLSTSYRYRDAFSDGQVAAKSQQLHVGASYALTPTSSLVAGIGRNWGDRQYTELTVGYGFKF